MVVDEQRQGVKMYANRTRAALGAGMAAIFVITALLFYFIVPTPADATNPWLYQEPFKTLFFLIWLLVGLVGVVIGLYWMVTPLPLLQLTPLGMVYQQHPFVHRTIWWEDLYSISALTDARTVRLVRVVSLTLWFTIKPHAAMTYGGRTKLTWTIGQARLPVAVEYVERLIARYHTVRIVDRRVPGGEHDAARGEQHPAVGHSQGATNAKAAKRHLRRRVTLLVGAFVVGLVAGTTGIGAVLYFVFGVQGAPLTLLELLFSLVWWEFLLSRLRRWLLSHPGGRQE